MPKQMPLARLTEMLWPSSSGVTWGGGQEASQGADGEDYKRSPPSSAKQPASPGELLFRTGQARGCALNSSS